MTKLLSRPDEIHAVLRPFDDGIGKQYAALMAELIHEAEALKNRQEHMRAEVASLEKEIKAKMLKVSGYKDNLRSGLHMVDTKMVWLLSRTTVKGDGKALKDQRVLEWHLCTTDEDHPKHRNELVRREPTTEADRQLTIDTKPEN